MFKKSNMILSCYLHTHRVMATNRNRPFTVIVEGNIGSGKTTFMNFFEKYRDVALFSEPVNKWRNVEGHNLLGKMYSDPKKWAMSFQSYVQLTMVDLHKQQCSEPIKLMERSLFSARYCFVENLYQNGFLDDPEYAVLDEWFKWICKNIDVGVDMIVYLRTKPDVALERMKARGRSEEKEVSLPYLEQLHKLHEKWLCPMGDSISSPPVHVIDANQDILEIEKEVKRITPYILGSGNKEIADPCAS